MPEYSNLTQFSITDLTKDLAERHIESLVALANQIPGVEYTKESILSEQKGDRRLQGKWQHSLIVLNQKEPIAFIIAYERSAEGNQQYPDNTLYISELAVSASHQKQGIARNLLRDFFRKNYDTGMLYFDNELNYSIQTNSADWNTHVVDLYKSFGFQERAEKEYDNRTDLVLGAKAIEIKMNSEDMG